ncbi:MAG TPA: hypothetical protein PL078_01080 [Bacillota bacterium]|jgi:hypothetical protein|nr:hypothetical protein [Peptococcaceae bacterium MAG4]NLW37600.1 hypothetical protein [Peptococcaceae bacterium]HPZ42571.1 hypothetical protein [Bacillota bacterium]HQD76776.1 hypothetical protein [Bacillota bacterium]
MFWYWESVVYAGIIWLAVFILVEPGRLKELWPVGFISSAVFFTVHLNLLSTGLSSFPNGFLTVFGVPFFHLVWVFGAGILLMNYMQRDFTRRLMVLIIFTLLGFCLDLFSVSVGGHIHSSSFDPINSLGLIFFRLIVFVWFSDGFFAERIYGKEKMIY